jgi:hypothetical protein
MVIHEKIGSVVVHVGEPTKNVVTLKTDKGNIVLSIGEWIAIKDFVDKAISFMNK